MGVRLFMVRKNLILVEGPCEKKFLQTFRADMRILGEIQVLNVLKDKATTKHTGKKYHNVYFVFDYDLLESTNRNIHLNCLKANIDRFKSISNASNIYLIIQYRDFEEELIRGLELKSKKDLFGKFNSHSKSEFKTEFIRTIDRKPGLKFNFYNMYVRRPEYTSLFEKILVLSGKEIFKFKK